MRKNFKGFAALGMAAVMLIGCLSVVSVDADAKGRNAKTNNSAKKSITEINKDYSKKSNEVKDALATKTVEDALEVTDSKTDDVTGDVTVGETVDETGDNTTETPVRIELKAKAVCSSDGKVNIIFNQEVEWAEDAAVNIKDADSNDVSVQLVEKNETGVQVTVEGIVKGQKYDVTITGVKAAGEEEFQLVQFCLSIIGE